MKKDDLTTYLLIGGAAYGAYWYLTNYGPSGAVFNAQGAKIAASYWDSWFGGASVAASTGSSSGAAPGATQQPPAVPLSQQLLSMALKDPTTGQRNPYLSSANTFNADQWNYYLQRIPAAPQIAPQDFETIYFSGGRPSDASQYPQLTSEQFVSMLVASNPTKYAGLGDIVNGLPSMASGGGPAFTGAFGGSFRGKGWVQ